MGLTSACPPSSEERQAIRDVLDHLRHVSEFLAMARFSGEVDRRDMVGHELRSNGCFGRTCPRRRPALAELI